MGCTKYNICRIVAQRSTQAVCVLSHNQRSLVIPLVLAQAWGRFRIAGMIAGTALALLLHVTLAVIGLTLLYRGFEWLCARAPRGAMVLAAVLAVAAAVVFVGSV